MPVEAYVDRDLFERERERCLGRAWRLLGRSADVALPGVWRAADVGGARLLVVRGDDLVLRAFHDLCRHRAAPLTAHPCGAARAFECPYHGWTYALDGSLLRAPHSQSLLKFDPREQALVPAGVVEWGGFVLARPDPGTEQIVAPAGPLARVSQPRLVRISERAAVTHANWKLIVENFQESHHFPRVHPALERHTPWRDSTSFFSEGPWLGGTMELAPGRETVSPDGSRAGRPYLAGLPDAERARVWDYCLFPLVLFSVQPDYVLSYSLAPLAVDATRVVASLYVDETARALPDAGLLDLWAQIDAEDRDICERQQAALASGAWRAGRFVDVEDGVHAFAERCARALLEIVP